LAAVRNGDRIRLSVQNKRIDLLVDEKTIAARLAGFVPLAAPRRGYAALYQNSVTQAPEGCDFDFLAGP
jgi:dihydroxy-acid dehydratase